MVAASFRAGINTRADNFPEDGSESNPRRSGCFALRASDCPESINAVEDGADIDRGGLLTAGDDHVGLAGNQPEQPVAPGGEKIGELERKTAGKGMLRAEERFEFGVVDDDALDLGESNGAGASFL